MDITYKDLNEKEIIMSKENFIELIDEYTELKEQVIALQEVLSKVLNIEDGNLWVYVKNIRSNWK